MGNQPISSSNMVPATNEFKNTFWKYTWYPVETLKIYRVAEITDYNDFEVFDGAGVYGTKYKHGNRTVYSTAIMPNDNRHIKKLVMMYSIPNFEKFVDNMKLTVHKMSKDGSYAEVTITTTDRTNKKTYKKTAIFKRWSLFF